MQNPESLSQSAIRHTQAHAQRVLNGESIAVLPDDNCILFDWPDNKSSISFVTRGTRNVIAFKKRIDDMACVNLAKNFYGTWVNTQAAGLVTSL